MAKRDFRFGSFHTKHDKGICIGSVERKRKVNEIYSKCQNYNVLEYQHHAAMLRCPEAKIRLKNDIL